MRAYRRQRRDRRRDLSLDVTDEHGPHLHDCHLGPAEQAERRDLVASVFADLEERERAVLELILDGWTWREAAEQLGMSIRTVARALHRAAELARANGA
jgi:RNA polymerase sigma factor (sigma-70 family)